MAVFVLDPISPRALARLGSGVVDWRDPAIALWPEKADAVITRTSPVGAADIERARHLKIIGKHGVGVDNIAVAAARARGIPVVNTPGANGDAVAELVLGLALAAARHIVTGDRALRLGNLAAAALPNGRELAGRRLGIVGFGQVGRRVAALFARALGMSVAAYDAAVPGETIRAGGAAPAASFEALLRESDLLSLHVPLTRATLGLIGARELALMTEGSILVNTARGGVVDEAALADALRRGRPAVAASDVFALEPPPPDHPLLELPNFIATPHLGAATEEALERVGFLVVDQVLEVLAGRPARHPVIPQ
ncbi:MAG TPA: hydroxyacid dehydrogenase [Stellaceae bacterium]|nr:hydroxyacid dehydrogenase [Stellaceae bacterium]